LSSSDDPNSGETLAVIIPEDKVPAGIVERAAAKAIAWLLPGVTAAAVLADKVDVASAFQEFIFQTINIWVLDNIFRPIIQAVLWIGGAFIDGMLLIAFGPDTAIGGPSYGVADGAVWIADESVSLVVPIGASLVGVIDTFNQALAEIAASAGIAAPVVVGGLWIAEGAVVSFFVWKAISVVDFPVIDLDNLIRAVTFPPRWFLGLFS
jgi:hypothetical protein